MSNKVISEFKVLETYYTDLLICLKIKEYTEGVRINCLVFYERITYKDWLIRDSWVLFINYHYIKSNSVY